ncbi:MAG: pentapeptide repeat-containing protein [Leptolyngbyaceae cyanobacterium SL_7_1]|nr:pentapeptide repeat-containing protein [Leptolyngbyaceae cyanobacterium SL_7_1]
MTSNFDPRSEQPSASPPIAASSPSTLNGSDRTNVDSATSSDPELDETLKPITPSLASARQPSVYGNRQPPVTLILLLAIVVMLSGLLVNSFWLRLVGASVALPISLYFVWQGIRPFITEVFPPVQRRFTLSLVGLLLSSIVLLRLSGISQIFWRWYLQLNWDAVGASGEVFGALGQILIAVLAVYVAWRQYVIEKELTSQQNRITQQQTIDSYFQGISELALDSEGLLEDWPQERAIAEGRTAALLSSVDAEGKSKIVRFLSRSRLLSPLKRDRHLGRAILDGMGGYQEDRDFGVRVIDLGVMLAGTNLANTDLRWVDLSDANLIRANLSRCELVKANFARTILYEATLAGSDMMGTRLFYGKVATASPRSRTGIPNYATGEFTGAVVENADLTSVQRLSADQRWYCCAWGGSKTRETIPGGCEGVPDLLG